MAGSSLESKNSVLRSGKDRKKGPISEKPEGDLRGKKEDAERYWPEPQGSTGKGEAGW